MGEVLPPLTAGTCPLPHQSPIVRPPERLSLPIAGYQPRPSPQVPKESGSLLGISPAKEPQAPRGRRVWGCLSRDGSSVCLGFGVRWGPLVPPEKVKARYPQAQAGSLPDSLEDGAVSAQGAGVPKRGTNSSVAAPGNRLAVAGETQGPPDPIRGIFGVRGASPEATWALAGGE